MIGIGRPMGIKRCRIYELPVAGCHLLIGLYLQVRRSGLSDVVKSTSCEIVERCRQLFDFSFQSAIDEANQNLSYWFRPCRRHSVYKTFRLW